MNRGGIHFFLDGFGVSGGHRIISSITRELSRRGANVSVYVPESSPGPSFSLGDSVEVVRLPTVSKDSLAQGLSLASLTLACSRINGVVVVMRQRVLPFAVAGVLMGRLKGHNTTMAMLVQHLSPLGRFKMGVPDSPREIALSFAASGGYNLPIHYIAVSHWLARSAGLEDPHIVSNGVDLTAFFPGEERSGESSPNARCVIGSFARRSTLKGFDIFLDAVNRFSAAMKKQIHVRLVEVDGRDRAWIEDSMPDDVSWEIIVCENDAELREFYQSIDIFVFSSRNEGFGLPPLEAMACRTAVVTSDCGGVRDYATESNCVIVEPEAAALARGIRRLVLDEKLRGRLEDAGLEVARSRPLTRQARRHAEILIDLLEDACDSNERLANS